MQSPVDGSRRRPQQSCGKHFLLARALQPQNGVRQAGPRPQWVYSTPRPHSYPDGPVFTMPSAHQITRPHLASTLPTITTVIHGTRSLTMARKTRSLCWSNCICGNGAPGPDLWAGGSHGAGGQLALYQQEAGFPDPSTSLEHSNIWNAPSWKCECYFLEQTGAKMKLWYCCLFVAKYIKIQVSMFF